MIETISIYQQINHYPAATVTSKSKNMSLKSNFSFNIPIQSPKVKVKDIDKKESFTSWSSSTKHGQFKHLINSEKKRLKTSRNFIDKFINIQINQETKYKDIT